MPKSPSKINLEYISSHAERFRRKHVVKQAATQRNTVLWNTVVDRAKSAILQGLSWLQPCFTWLLWFCCWLNRCDSRRTLPFTLFFWNSWQICLYSIAADVVIPVKQTRNLANCACLIVTSAFIPLCQRSSNLLNSLNLSQNNNRFPRNVNQGTEMFLI